MSIKSLLLVLRQIFYRILWDLVTIAFHIPELQDEEDIFEKEDLDV